ncbi:Aspartic protease, partial [Globisporangium splendens]
MSPMSSPRALGGYYGDISLGIPPQTFTVQFEANCYGSAWVANFPSGSKHRFYNHSKSSSYVANGTTFGDPESFASGFYSKDTMQFGDFTIHHQLFAEVNNAVNYPEHPRTALDGIVSLRRDTTPVDPIMSMTLFRRLVESRVLEKPVFTFCYVKGVVRELTIGGFDERHYTDRTTYVPLVVSFDWRIPLDAISVNGNRVTMANIAWITTALPVIQWPPKEVEALAKIVGAKFDNKYEIECSSSGPEIVIGGTKFALNKDDYALRTKGSTTCHWAINSMTEQTDERILGIPFIEKFYTIFDWGTGTEGTDGRIGIALRA